MSRLLFVLVLSAALFGEAPVIAADADVKYAGAGAWVVPPPAAAGAATPPEAPLSFAYADTQVRVGPTGEEDYSAYRAKILKTEALPLGNVALTWNPGAGDATVHYLRILRDGQTIDVLKDQRFQVLQRERGLEQSMLDGRLTATLQVPGLKVGDEIEFAATVRHRDPTLADHVFGLNQFPVQSVPGAFRYRLSWPDGYKLAWRATNDLPQGPPAAGGGGKVLTVELRDPGSAIPTEGAPARYNVRRLLEFSDFADWADVSKRVWTLFDAAARLAPNSPLAAETDKIAAATRDPVERAQAALRLIEEQVRYVYVGLNGGNYLPANADETWARRFGDCKAKTAALLAVLRRLGIEAEAVLVNGGGDDGLDARLPSPLLFNHVLVRATIAGKPYWLDGTRLGDRYLDVMPAPVFRWALPLRQAGSGLEAVAPVALAKPLFVAVLDVDARAGIGKPAKVTSRHIVRQDEAYALRAQLAVLPAADADRALRTYWRQQMDWVEPDQVSWRYDERRAQIVLTLTGEGKPAWKGDDAKGWSLEIDGAGFYKPDLLRRPREQDQTAPWATEFPRFRCWATTVRLPPAPPKWRWTYYADPMNLRMGGVAYWRGSGLQDGVMETVMSRQSYLPEIGPAEATALNAQVPSFNNNISSVYLAAATPSSKPAAAGKLPFVDSVDWEGSADACVAPAGAK